MSRDGHVELVGATTVHLARDELWSRLSDPDVFAAALPGCHSLTPADDDRFDVIVTTGVGGASGTYRGTAHVAEVARPDRCRVILDVVGEPGTVRAELTLELIEDPADPAATTVHHHLVAELGGQVRGVGRGVVEGSLLRTLEAWLQGLADVPAATDADPDADADADPDPDADADADAEPDAGPGRGVAARRGAVAALALLAVAAVTVAGGLVRRRASSRSPRGSRGYRRGGSS